MKKGLFLLLSFLIWSASIATAQCPSGNLSFSTQAEINNFKVNHPACTNFANNITVQSLGNITSLNGLSNLVSIGGDFIIYNNYALSSLSGLSSLQSIGGGFTIASNNALTNLSGLSSLKNIGNEFYLEGNQSLTNINDLSSLKSIGGSVNISGNNTLSSLSGLTSLQSIGGELSLMNNNALANLNGLSSLQSIKGKLSIGSNNALNSISGLSALRGNVEVMSITSNPSLTNLDGLVSLTTIEGNVFIVSNSQLTNVNGLSSLTSIGGDFALRNNTSLTSTNGLSSLRSIGGGLSVGNNSSLITLSGLSSLTGIGGNLDIGNNASLTNLDGLSSMGSIGGGNIYLMSNDKLGNISGLSSIASSTIKGLFISYNPLLSVCHLPNFCAFLANDSYSHQRFIFSNAADCISEGAIVAACPPNPVVCIAPTVRFDSKTETTATFSWNSESNASAYDWIVVKVGANPYTAEPLQSGRVTAGIAIATGLSASTSYNFYVKTDCGSGNTSSWSQQLSFTTTTCPSGNLSFYSQADIDNFKITYPLCTSLAGLVTVQGNTISNLNGLSNIESVGSLMISNTNSLTNLNGLSYLANISDSLSIKNNSALKNITALSALTNITGSISINSNSVLSDISGLSNVETGSITSLKIIANPLLSICDLPNFCTYLSKPTATHPRDIQGNSANCSNETAFGANCPINCENYIPTQVSVTAIKTSGATFTWNAANHATAYDWIVIADWTNPATAIPVASGRITGSTVSITGLQENTPYDFYVKTVCGSNGESFWSQKLDFTTIGICPLSNPIFFNQANIDNFKIVYPACTHLQTDVNIGGTGITNLDGLSNLVSISGSLSISYNNDLTNLSGLSSLENIGGGLTVSYNSALTNINGLSSITRINGYLTFYNNSELIDISGISKIAPETIRYIDITSNPKLSVCSLPNFCTYLSNSAITHPRSISRNATNCINVAAVTSACIPPCNNTVTLTSPGDDYSSGTQTRQAKAVNGKISAVNKITSTAQVNYEAASVELLPGFMAEAKNGAVFRAVVGGCY